MENINLLKILFGQMSAGMLLLSGVMNCLENYLPIYLVRVFRYGKFAYQGTSKCLLAPIEVPKAWFKHFYVYSTLLFTILMILITNTYVFNNTVPGFVLRLLNVVCGTNRYVTVSPIAAYLASILMTLQCYRRLYDTQFVSVFGANSRMNIIHYFIGFIHYTGVAISILSEAPHFANTNEKRILKLKFEDISYVEIFASVLFLWAWWHQYKATEMLANLRKNPKGKIVSNAHLMPSGDLFEYVSSPHILTEIVMYLSVTIILWSNTTWWYIFIWVLCNQIETALLTHWWYKQTFPNYPTNRKALIPYIF